MYHNARLWFIADQTHIWVHNAYLAHLTYWMYSFVNLTRGTLVMEFSQITGISPVRLEARYQFTSIVAC